MIARPLARWMARGKPLVPDAAWPLLLTLRSVRGQKPLLGLPDFRRVLVLAAHPDDESIGCSGTMALLTEGGRAEVTVAFATDGEATTGSASTPAETGRLRAAQARESCRLLGVERLRFLGLPDGSLAARTAELARHITALVEELEPEVVFVPWFLDGHPDHQALTPALALAGLRDDLQVWAFETWTPLPANRLVDISAVVDRKQAALAAHSLASQAFDLSAMQGLSRWRSVHAMMGQGYAEGFLAGSLRDYLDVADRVVAAP